ncbi:MAG TPA: thioredoxin family protein [Ignavibacteriales bacterium]|nr:thioredoxin family protein [Ignavibacteriales bacterium]
MKFFACMILSFSFASFIYGQTEDTLKSENAAENMLIGDCVREDFQDTSFARWFDPEYSEYQVDTAAADSLSGIIDSADIVIVLGTWCSDSHREIPRFIKILDYLKYPSEKLTMKCVDRKLKTLSSDIDIYQVEAVPSIIFYEEGKELGRIIEAPEESLEKDMIKFIVKR